MKSISVDQCRLAFDRHRPRRRPNGPSGCPGPTAWGALRSAIAALSLTSLTSLMAAGPAAAGNLTSVADLAQIRTLADGRVQPTVDQRAALLNAASQSWRWGSVSGEFVTTLVGLSKRCHPASDASQVDYLKEGAPDAYAKVLAYFVASQPDRALADEARARVLDLVDTTGYRGLGGEDLSASNQCALELGISIPVWIETAKLLESTPVWSNADRLAFADWLAREVYPRVAWASRARRNNWGAAGSASASLIAHHVDGLVPTLTEQWPAQRTLTPAEARAEHDAQQLERIRTTWRADGRCSIAGIQPYGGIPDELRRGAAGCDGVFLPSGSGASHTYQTMHAELLVLHAEAQRRRGSTTLFDATVTPGTPAILQAILFVIDNPSAGSLSWPWGTRTGALAVAYRYYLDPRLGRELDRSEAPEARGGRTLPYAKLSPMPPTPPAVLVD